MAILHIQQLEFNLKSDDKTPQRVQLKSTIFMLGLLLYSTHACSKSLTSKFAGSSPKVSACSSQLWMPFNWEAGGSLEGAAVNVAQWFFDSRKVELERVVMGSWARCLKSIEEGRVDLAIAVYKTPERQVFGDYVAEPMAFDTVKIYVNRDRPIEFDKLTELAQFRGAGVRGDSYGLEFDRFKQQLSPPNWTETNRAMQNVQRLMLGRIDYTLMNPWNLKLIFLQLAEDGEETHNKIVEVKGHDISHNGLYFLFSKKSNRFPEFGTKMAQYIRDLKSSGDMEAIISASFNTFRQGQLAVESNRP